MKWLVYLGAAGLALAPHVASSSEFEPDEEEQGHLDTATYRVMWSHPGDDEAGRHLARDLKYVDQMSEHHRGAVRMSEAYLDDPRGDNPFLRRMARAIIFNQQFEIDWMADIKRRLAAGPDEILRLGDRRLLFVPQGLTGMEHRARFKPAPIRSVDNTIDGAKPFSVFDVTFAKGMKMHHEMALEMAHAYNRDPAGGNRVIKEINRGILADQAVEIGILADVMAAYDGDADAIAIPQEMKDMMGMPMEEMGPHADH